MKKVFVFVLACLLSLSLFCIGSFAYDPVDAPSKSTSFRSITLDHFAYPYAYTFVEVLSPPSSSSSSPFEFTCDNVLYYGMDINRQSLLYYTSSDFSTYITVYSNGHWVSDIYRYIIISDSNFTNSAFAFLKENEFNKFSPQVGASLNLIGRVLTFISSNSFILVFVGLSIGLFLVVPFSIRKFKQFVKGY